MEQFGTVCEKLGNTKNFSRKGNLKGKKSRCWAFTFNNPENGTVLLLIEKFKSLNCEYVFQKEKSRSGTIHLQGGIYFKNPRSMKFQKKFSERIHWEFGRNWRNLKNYCCKLDTRVSGPYTNISGLEFRKSIRDPLKGLQLYAWQEFILNICEDEPDDRKIYWIWSENGNMGKSSFCKHLKIKFGDFVSTIGGTSKDAFYGIKERLEKNVDLKIILIDIARSKMSNISYESIEKLKDGYFYSSKYESKEILMNPPHIFVFANCKPYENLMSKDRWFIMNVDCPFGIFD